MSSLAREESSQSKEGLVHEVLQTHLEAIRTGSAPLKYDVDSWEDLERWFHNHLHLQQKFRMTRGCPFGRIGNEVKENDELIRQDLCLIFEVMRSKFSAFFVKQKAKGSIARNADVGALADYCMATVQGAMLMGKIERSSRPVETTVAQALKYLRGFLPPSSFRSLIRFASSSRVRGKRLGQTSVQVLEHPWPGFLMTIA